MRFENITFKNSRGEVLNGRIDLPLVGSPGAYVLFAHCFTCSKSLMAVDNISRAITLQGMAVLRFDFTGLGHSEGDFSDTNFTTNLSDLKSAYEYLEINYRAPQIIIGHSLGGIAVIHVAFGLPSVKAVVTIGAPANPTHVGHLISDSKEEIIEKGSATVDIGGRPFTIKKQFIDDLEKYDCRQVIGSLNRSLLIMHSPQDNIVGIENAAEIYQNAKHPKSYVSLDGADHLLSKKEDSEYVGLMISAWAKRYITDQREDLIAEEGEVWTRVGESGYLTEITAGKHQLLADEPASVGGSDLGPSPYGFLLSALGSCTAMTLRMYANFKKIDLKEVKVVLTHDKIHAADTDDAEDQKGKIDRIKREIEISGDLTSEERKRLIEIADRCPVHKTLEGKPEIVTSEIK